MTETAEYLRGSPTPLERRQYPRRKVNDICYIVFLDGVNGGLVLNISETGLLLQAALRVTNEEVSRLRFQLPSSNQWVEACAKLVWVDESGKEAGAQFLELPEGAQARIKEWVGSRDVSPSPASIPEQRHVQQQAANESSGTKARIPVVDPAHAAAAPRAVVRPKRETALPLWGLGRVLFLVAIAVVALLGFRYSPQLSQLAMAGRSKQARNIVVGVAKRVRSLYANAVTRSAGRPPQLQSPKVPLNAVQGGAGPRSSPGRQLAPLGPQKEHAESKFGLMVTQTLSPNPAAPEPNAAGIRSQSRVQRHTRRGSPSSNASHASHIDISQQSNAIALVGAPAVGEPPARVVFQRVPVEASSLVAITQRRSILVPGSSDPTEELQLGKLVSHVEPVYPIPTEAGGVEATVRVRAFIGRSGNVLSVQRLSGPGALARAAVDAVRVWRYDPTLLNGQPIESQSDITIYFRLH